MSDNPLDSTLTAIAQALDAARTERDQLRQDVANLIAQRDQLALQIREAQRSLDSIRDADAIAFVQRCVDAGIDRFSIAELRLQLEKIRAAGPVAA